MTKTHYCPVEKTTISYEDECNWCGEKENDMKEEALKLAAALDVESSQAEYGYVVDDWKLFSDSADMIRKLVAELDKKWYLIDTHGYVEPQPKPLSDEEVQQIFNDCYGWTPTQKETFIFARAIEERHGIK